MLCPGDGWRDQKLGKKYEIIMTFWNLTKVTNINNIAIFIQPDTHSILCQAGQFYPFRVVLSETIKLPMFWIEGGKKPEGYHISFTMLFIWRLSEIGEFWHPQSGFGQTTVIVLMGKSMTFFFPIQI